MLKSKDLPSPDLARLERIREQAHGDCFACAQGLFRLEYQMEGARLVATVHWDAFHCSYENTVHGGAISLYLDQIMTCLLFAYGVEGVTARMELRYHKPVRPLVDAHLSAWLEECHGPLFRVRAQLEQEGEKRVSVKADFVRRAKSFVKNGRSEE